ncbi:MAG: PIN domain-containing protein [Candidatus Latescibacteria bacterium]|nr:PIN domain-containing protein [Candidatus Latescibacterota bacterium]
MNRFALDTSILLRWFARTSDADAERALLLRQEHLAGRMELIVLDQSLYELIQVLEKGAGWNQPSLAQAMASLEQMHLQIVPYSHAIASRATQIADELDLSVASACFVALGAHLRCQALTCDESLYRKVASLPWTVLLSQLNLSL